MSPQQLVSLAIKSGYDVRYYDDHVCVSKHNSLELMVTIPRVPMLAKKLVDKVKGILGLKD